MSQSPGQGDPKSDLLTRIAQSLLHIFPDAPPKSLGVAVSGGGDSVALLVLLNSWAQENGCILSAVTIDHGLRDASGDEAIGVGLLCKKLGLSHEILKWQGWDGGGNLQKAARDARYQLMTEWAQDRSIGHIALGHTRDDQAETVLMRLARGSGVDGLSAMSRTRLSGGVTWLRPMLDVARLELREYLRETGIDWVDDPSNDDERFDRVRMRRALTLLEPLGIDAENLAATATRMGSARRVLAQCAADAAETIVSIKAGAVFLETGGLTALADETRRRLLNHALCWVSHNQYGPRARALARLWDQVTQGETTTLHGCLILKTKSHVVVTRENSAVAEETCSPDEVWGQSWRVHGPKVAGLYVAVTGPKGLKTCTEWRETGLPRAVLLAAPAVWKGDELVAAPMAGYAHGWRAEFLRDQNDFVRGLLSH